MDAVLATLSTLMGFLSGLVPLIPYALTILVVYGLMKKVIKPWVRSHVNASGKFESTKWASVDRFMFLYPAFLGALCYFVTLVLFPGFHGAVGYFVSAGMGAQLVFHYLEHFLKERGIDLPSDFEA